MFVMVWITWSAANCFASSFAKPFPTVQGGFTMRRYIPELMPLIVDALLDGAAAAKREVAVATLGQVVQSTGYVVSFIRLLFLNYFLYSFCSIVLKSALAFGGDS